MPERGGAHCARAPLFLLGLHRGGTTYVQRILNCHRGVVLWGENGGLVTHLRRAHVRARNLSQTDVARYQQFDEFAAEFIPWASPVDQAGLSLAMASFVRQLHEGAAPVAFWGFKEIRHANREDLRFLRALFPDARVVLLLRHPRDVLRSQLHAPWAPRLRRKHAATRARRFVKRYVRAVSAFREAADAHPQLTRLLRYEDLLAGRAILELFRWLGLELDADDRSRAAAVRSARAGSSFAEGVRPIDPAILEEVIGSFDAELASALERLDAEARGVLLSCYPDLDGSVSR